MLQTLRHWLLRVPRAQRVELRGRRCIVTGAARGSIGFATARTLAAWGADVVVTTRGDADGLVAALRASLADHAGHGTVSGHALDLCTRASVDDFVRWYRQQHGEQLDLLINNAGVHLDLLSQWQTPRLSADGHEIHWRTNYLGTMQLTLALLPLLQNSGRHSGDARIVNLVSMLHSKGRNDWLFAPQPHYNSWAAYGTSKLALVHASFELHRRHAHTDHVQAYCLHPGAVYTNIADQGLAGNPRLQAVRRWFAPLERCFLLTAEEGAQTSLHCATAADALGGQYYRNSRPAPASADSQDREVAARLWQQTLRAIDAHEGRDNVPMQ